ncbi:hypothetical protein BUALT_Bualt14G0018900 [Buddleja alternifolia]|uniref:Uncharacterized protein n=1 Tax=Buddleja alternifolia TaxID=168488 RepID=A0AAV6WRF0_9LAMI|nr:hypothetical protein BUALT_Bualt14G0018900 [Buddleja alternifolia]
MTKAMERMVKPLMPFCTKLPIIIQFRVRKNKVDPIFAESNNHVLFLSDRGTSLDYRRDDEYLQARRAILNSYHLRDGHNLKKKMQSSLKSLSGDVVAAVHTRVGVRAYKFTLGCPWNNDIFIFTCFLPHLKCVY